MALKGLDIFKLTPKTNCKECGNPTCMAFSMKVAQGAIALDACPYLSQEVIDQLSEATAPPMVQMEVGSGDFTYSLGGETVLMRHDKTFVSKSLYAVQLTDDMAADAVDALIEKVNAMDYDRIGERMIVDALYLVHNGGDYKALVEKAMATGRVLVLDCKDVDAAKAALDICADKKPILHGATPENLDAMKALAEEKGVTLGLAAGNLSDLHDAIEAAGTKNLVVEVASDSGKKEFEAAVTIRRSAITDGDRTFGYPTIVNVANIAPGNPYLQGAYAALFTCKYGSIIVLEDLDYALSLPLHGLRQNIFTDPQKPMKVEPGIYPLNGADENSPCATTVDFALTYFVVSGELERSGVPINLVISDAGGYSVLTAWAAGKLSASSIAKFMEESVADKVKTRTLILPGKVAVLKGELQDKLPDWDIVVGPNEAIQLVQFMKEL